MGASVPASPPEQQPISRLITGRNLLLPRVWRIESGRCAIVADVSIGLSDAWLTVWACVSL
jgi:hypothetical protein